MRTKHILLVGCLMLATNGILAQAWDEGGNTITNLTKYVGCDANSTVPLKVMHNANQPIEWYTNAARRMLLSPTLTNQTVNGFPGLDLSGFLGIGNFNPNVSNAPHEPYALLHLDDWGLTPGGYRPWMRAGTLITKGSDMAFFGMRSGYAGATHTVVAWCDNSPADIGGPDLLKFIFSSRTGSGTGVAGTTDGLEAARFLPLAGGNATNFGLGDWTTAATNPTERLDVLDGRVRIRQLPTDPVSTSLEAVVVNTTTGVLEHRPFPTGGGADCKWTLLGSGNTNIATAYSGNPGCPQADRKVGIGTGWPVYKLDVRQSEVNGAMPGAVNVEFVSDGIGQSNGLVVDLRPASGVNALPVGYGVFSTVVDVGQAETPGYTDGYAVISRMTGSNPLNHARRHRGVWGDAATNGGMVTEAVGVYGSSNITGGAVTNAYGVYGESHLSAGTATYRYGVYGKSPTTANSWAGMFAGNVTITGNGFVNGSVAITSDAQFKTGVEDMNNATEVLAALRPKRYTFTSNTPPGMYLPEGRQYGVLAQELESVLPELVLQTTHPAQYDTAGVRISEALDYKAVNYIGLIPILIAGFNEQEAKIAELQHQLAACCANPDRSLQQPTPAGGPTVLPVDDATGDDKLRIVPNPFSEPPTVHYTLERGGRAQLMVHGGDGRGLRVLHEATMEPGNYQLRWDTNALAPGMYYVTLLLDGQPVVEKAVKVAR